MNAKVAPVLGALGLCLAFAACSTYPEYPMTYQVPVGPAQISSAYGPMNLAVNGVQDVSAQPGQQLYFQVIAPTPIVLYAFDKTSSSPGGPLLAQLSGTTFYSSVTPSSDSVEFVVSAQQPVTGGSVQLTVSDQPMSSSGNAIPYTTPAGPPGVGTAVQPPVSLSPSNVTIAPGQSVTFTAGGGAGSGAYIWGGAASASGYSNQYTFNAPGTYTVSVYRTGDQTYAQSNTATATVDVSATNYAAPAASPNVTVTPVH